ncbi:uncharacterized protein K452DRAFT_227522 [Aplosporella prunicola CBS 121167]|uniref:Myb-like domain-containing protein n=1 Tax=Aplosporella prunicola CBS 121167 TaxID=1176127 RepID=A0A6A6BEL6_9PEZI|nr:uncharacterized protein K452DRAFT_227522 [Aplosporella prunicola CBS 121167]KAF2141978.1 hypothetical protein K452DRAFT_227522 [Aplosporella prunicola CBS 121167]
MDLPAQIAGGSARGAAQWLSSDDETLMAARASGLSWQVIAPRYFPEKSPNACRKRHERLIEKRNAEDWDGIKIETLAKEYMDVRREMWSVLADRVGEKWTVVEAKCMERGMKNLQAAYRAAQRKERGNSEEGDSGIGCSDAETELDDNCSVDSSVAPSTRPGDEVDERPQRGGPSIQSLLSPEPSYSGQPKL